MSANLGDPIDGLMSSDELMLNELERRDGIYSFIFHELETSPAGGVPLEDGREQPRNGYSSGEDSIIQQYFNELLSSSPDICSEVTTRNRSLNAIVTTSAQTYILPPLVPAMSSYLPCRLGTMIVTKVSAPRVVVKCPAARRLETSPTPPSPPAPPLITSEQGSFADSPMLHERDPLMSMGATPPPIRSLPTCPATVVQHTSAIRPLSTVLQHTSAIRPAATVLRHTSAVNSAYTDVPLLKNEELLRPPSPLLEPANPPKVKTLESPATDHQVMPTLIPLHGSRTSQKASSRVPSAGQRSYVRGTPPVTRQRGAATTPSRFSLEGSPSTALKSITFVKPVTLKGLTAKPSATIVRPPSPSSPPPCDQWDSSRALPPISTLRPSTASSFGAILGPSSGAGDLPRLSPFITWGNGYCHEYSDIQRRPPPPYRPPSCGSSTQSPKSGLDLDMLDSYGPMSFGSYNFRILHRSAEPHLGPGAALVRNRKHALKETAEFKNFLRIVNDEPLPYTADAELPDLRQLFPHDPDVHAPFKGEHVEH